MKKFLIIIIIFIIFITVILINFRHGLNNLISPTLSSSQKVEISPSLSPGPQTFQFDGKTDLKRELEKVDPKVLDSDFE